MIALTWAAVIISILLAVALIVGMVATFTGKRIRPAILLALLFGSATFAITAWLFAGFLPK